MPRTPKFKKLEFNDRWFDLIPDITPEQIAAIVNFVRTGTLPADERLAEQMYAVFEQIDAEQRHRAAQRERRSQRMKLIRARRRQATPSPAPQTVDTPPQTAQAPHPTLAERRAKALAELRAVDDEAYSLFIAFYARFCDSNAQSPLSAWTELKSAWPTSWAAVADHFERIYLHQSQPILFTAFLRGPLPPDI